jgi:hypothetical protein
LLPGCATCLAGRGAGGSAWTGSGRYPTSSNRGVRPRQFFWGGLPPRGPRSTRPATWRRGTRAAAAEALPHPITAVRERHGGAGGTCGAGARRIPRQCPQPAEVLVRENCSFAHWRCRNDGPRFGVGRDPDLSRSEREDLGIGGGSSGRLIMDFVASAHGERARSSRVLTDA